LWRGEDHAPETIALAFEEVFTTMEENEGPVSWKDDAAREKAREAGLRVVAAYLASPEVLTEPPKAVEVFLKEDVEGLSVPLTGAMDLVRRNLTPVDFKSAAARPDPEQAAFDHEIQLVAYQLMLEKATGETPPILELVFLVKTKTPQVIKVTVPPADRHRKQRVVRMLQTAVEGIAEGRFHPQPGMHCSWCSFRKNCAAWLPGGEGERRLKE
jgi:putative RecB family exonuclease